MGRALAKPIAFNSPPHTPFDNEHPIVGAEEAMPNSVLIRGAVVIGFGGLDGWKLQHHRALDRRAFEHFVLAVKRQRLQRVAGGGGPRFFPIALIFITIAHLFAREDNIGDHWRIPFIESVEDS